MTGPDGVDYGINYCKADRRCPGIQKCIDGRWYDVSPHPDGQMEPGGIYRRPMTQAEKDAEAGKAPESIADMVVDGYGMDGMPASIKIDEAEIRRIIEIVRAHDAKRKAGE